MNAFPNGDPSLGVARVTRPPTWWNIAGAASANRATRPPIE